MLSDSWILANFVSSLNGKVIFGMRKHFSDQLQKDGSLLTRSNVPLMIIHYHKILSDLFDDDVGFDTLKSLGSCMMAPRQSCIRLESNDESDLEHEACYLSDEEDEASSGYASEEDEEESEPEDHDDEDTARRHHYYYYYRQHPATAAAAYQHHRPRPWSSTMMAHPYYHHPQQYHHYAYTRGSWPVRRRKSSDTSIRSVPNLVRRSSSSASRFQGPPPPFVFPHDERMIRNRRAPINMM